MQTLTITIAFTPDMGLHQRNDLIKKTLKQIHAANAIKGILHKKDIDDMEYGMDEDLLFADSMTIEYKEKDPNQLAFDSLRTFNKSLTKHFGK